MKIRTRLSLQFILITISIYAFSMLFIYDRFKQHVENELYNHLESKARMTAEMVLFHEDDFHKTSEVKKPETIQIKDIGNTSIYNTDLDRIYSLISYAPTTPVSALQSIKQNGEFRFLNTPYKAFGYVYTSRKNANYIVVAEDKPDYSKLNQLRNILLFSSLFTILIVAFGGWFFAGQSLRPVSRIIHDVQEILPTDLSKRLISDSSNDELAQLVTTFNSLLDRIDNAFKTEKSFISNVSHELKNPLAAIRTQTQYATNKERTPKEYNQILESIEEDIQDMTTTIEKLLQLARVHSNAANITMSEVRLDELVYQAQAALHQTNLSYKFNIEMIHPPLDEDGMIIRGNEALLKIAFMNLMDNACKFSSNSTCSILIDFQAADHIILEFQNTGDPILSNEIDHLFKPFYRSHEHKKTTGSGIGLSLVKSILDLHAISIEIQADNVNGNRFILHINNTTPSTIIKPKISSTARISLWAISLGILFSFFACRPGSSDPTADVETKHLIDQWYQQYLSFNRVTDGYRPPVSARTFGFIGWAAWEAAVIHQNNAVSLADRYPGLTLPQFPANQIYHLPASLNALYFTMATSFYPHANMVLKAEAKNIYDRHLAQMTSHIDTGLLFPSDRYGKALAIEIYNYSSQDTISHLAYLYNFDNSYEPLDSPGTWKPTGRDLMPALLPYWGNSRVFIESTRGINVQAPLTYSELQNSSAFGQAWEIYTLSKSMTHEKKWIADFWSDDFHGITYCAASRWISIALQALKKKPALTTMQVLELMMKLGVGLNDAAVKTWEAKFKYHVERPESYIQRIIQSHWSPLHDSPSFPAYPSGHSIFGATAAGILTATFGEPFKLTDNSHKNRKEFLSKPRTFNSFKEMAIENALSRMYMGVHFRNDCEEGLRLGELISSEVLKLEIYTSKNALN